MFRNTLKFLVGCVPAHLLVSSLVEIIVCRYHLNCEMNYVNGELESMILFDPKYNQRIEICLDNFTVVEFNPYGGGCFIAEDLEDLLVYIFYILVYADKECDAVVTKLYHRFR